MRQLHKQSLGLIERTCTMNKIDHWGWLPHQFFRCYPCVHTHANMHTLTQELNKKERPWNIEVFLTNLSSLVSNWYLLFLIHFFFETRFSISQVGSKLIYVSKYDSEPLKCSDYRSVLSNKTSVGSAWNKTQGFGYAREI